MLKIEDISKGWTDILLVGMTCKSLLELQNKGVLPTSLVVLSVVCLSLAAGYGSGIINATIKEGVRLLVLLIWLTATLLESPGDLALIAGAMFLSLSVLWFLKRSPVSEWIVTVGLVLFAMATIGEAATWMGSH